MWGGRRELRRRCPPTGRVRIEAFEDAEQEGGDKPVAIPDRYNTDSTLTAEVQAGENMINFDLVSGKK